MFPIQHLIVITHWCNLTDIKLCVMTGALGVGVETQSCSYVDYGVMKIVVKGGSEIDN